MFRVKKPQKEALGDADFIGRMEEVLAEDLYGRKVTAEDKARFPFREMIAHGMDVARSYGFRTERDLATFVLHMVRINPDFHKQPTIHSILRDTDLSPSERREKLLTDVSSDEWNAAAGMTDADDYWDRHLPEPVARN
ncbi:MAG: hypothetical protein U0441_10110 [Polyangiaceae bacterium]